MSDFLGDMNEMQKDAQLEKIEEEYHKAKSQSKKRRDIINYIAEKICDEKYAKSQLGGPNKIFAMSDIELRDFVVENFYGQKKEMAQLVKDIQQLYQGAKNQIDELSLQILQLQKDLDTVKQSQKINPFQQPSITKEEEVKQEVDIETKDIIVNGTQVIDVVEQLNKLDLYQEELIKVIGEFGLSEAKMIYEKAKERTNTSDTTLKAKFSDVEKKGFLEKEEVSTFLRKKLALYSLNELGKIVYKKLTGQNPVVAEKDILKRQHATLQHAYCIKDTSTILEQLGYTNISIDSSKNSIQVAGGRRYVPDIVADFSPTEKTYWEVELGHHKDGDFFEKISKAAKVTSVLYIIANDRDSFDKLKRQVGRYEAHVLQTDQNIKITIFLGTMNQLKQRNIFTNPECKIKIG